MTRKPSVGLLLLWISNTVLAVDDSQVSLVIPSTADEISSILSQVELGGDEESRTHFESAQTNVSTTSGDTSTETNFKTKGATNEHCSVYLAPSSIPDAQTNLPAGFGIYTTRNIDKGDYIWRNGEGPSVVITDVRINYQHLLKTRYDYTDEEIPADTIPSWAQYIFLYPCVGFNMETYDPKMQKINSLESNMNLGSIANFHPFLQNVAYDDTDWYDDGLLDRYQDPGAGAFSYHRGKYWYAERDVEAGEELFADYGEYWFLDRQLGDSGKHIPRSKDYEKAAQMCEGWIDKAMQANHSDWLKQEDLDEVLSKYQGDNSERVLSLIPKTVEDMSSLLRVASDVSHKERIDALQMEMAKRMTIREQATVSWIEENGLCLENIVPRKSTIRQAGMGAFAQWSIKKGEVIVPVPTLVQVVNADAFDIFEMEDDGENYFAYGETPYTKQLLLNYCFGNPNSTMVVCPATNANLINHCGPLVKGEGACQDGIPNARVRFATEFDPMTKDWLNLDLADIEERVKNKQRGISLEVVALRDIEPNEEIFIDYGRSWEEAWLEHVRNWRPPDDEGFFAVSRLNKNVTVYLRTEEELETRPYPQDVRVGCFLQGFFHPCSILQKLDMTAVDVPLAYDEGDFLPGQRKPERLPVYKVEMTKQSPGGTWEIGYKWRFPNDSATTYVTSKQIRFFPGLYNSDQHLPGTFRHRIDAIPDDEWPEVWKNKKNTNVQYSWV
ncbi:SET methyltransferase domain containing protein [Nitzschia inconspicua]|uniref:SET methyltransferase domain containing protein n=1 Tax=Nitzschia inconspicua TaxID=303405 RepID=A0A9K3PG16_9STRA|nr:SET methyltransferase domain containing protein [Nitzschia inconspicua]